MFFVDIFSTGLLITFTSKMIWELPSYCTPNVCPGGTYREEERNRGKERRRPLLPIPLSSEGGRKASYSILNVYTRGEREQGKKRGESRILPNCRSKIYTVICILWNLRSNY